MTRLGNFFSGRRGASSTPPVFLALRSSRTFIISTVCLAVFTDIFLYGIIVPVIPFALSSRAGVAEDSVQQWVSILLAAYGGALLVASPVSGWYADNTSSRRLPLLLGLLALAGATVLLCLARSVGLLVTGRILQGLSSAVVWTVGTALLVDTVGQKDIGQVLGYVSMCMSLGILIAPLLGGVLYDKAGYYSVYYLCFGLMFVDIALRLILIEKKIAVQWIEEPALEPAISGNADVQNNDEGTRPNTAEIGEKPSGIQGDDPAALARKDEVNSAAPQGLSPVLEQPTKRRNKVPPIFSLLISRRLVAALWGCFVEASLMTAFDSTIPLFVQETFKWNSIGAGLTFLALMVPSFASPFVGYLSDNYGPRWLVVIGFLLAMPFWVLLRLVTYDSMGQKVLFFALLVLIGIALTLVMPPIMAEITYVVEAKEKKNPGIFGSKGAFAQAYGLFVTAFAAGSLVGPIWSGYVKAEAGWGTMTWTLGLFSVSGAVPALIWTGGLITKRNPKTGEERAVNGPGNGPDDSNVEAAVV